MHVISTWSLNVYIGQTCISLDTKYKEHIHSIGTGHNDSNMQNTYLILAHLRQDQLRNTGLLKDINIKKKLPRTPIGSEKGKFIE
jgi:predicted transposase YbfD/YdcC